MPSREHDAAVAARRAAFAPPPADVARWRAGWEEDAASEPVADGVAVEPLTVAGLRAEWLTPADAAPGRTVVWVHGGGYLLGSLGTHRQLVSRIAAAAGARTLQFEYRRGPEAPFPAALEDAVGLLRALLADGLDPARLVLGGDSAGGGLALATAVALRDGGDPLPAALVLMSPWADLTLASPSVTRAAAADPILTRAVLERMAAGYLGGAGADDPRVSPLFADLAGLPPLLIQAGTADCLADDAPRLRDRVAAAGGAVELERFEELMHVFQQNAPDAPEAEAAIARAGAFVARWTYASSRSRAAASTSSVSRVRGSVRSDQRCQ